MLDRLILVFGLLGGCTHGWLPEDEEPEDPPSICGDAAVTAGEQCDDGNRDDGDACSATCQRVDQYVVHWRTSSVSGAVHSCPTGFDLADVILQPVAAADGCFPELSRSCPALPNGPEIVHTAECADGAARVQAAPRFTREGYLVSVRFVSSETGEVYGQTLSRWLTEVADVTMHEESGFARLTWDLRSATGEALVCAGANVDVVRATFTHTSGSLLPITMAIPCNELTAISPPLLRGDWDLELVARQDVTRITGIQIGPRSALTDPGPIVLTMSGM